MRTSSLSPRGDKLRSLRVSLGWTQLELAVRAGVSERTVRKAEKGQPLRRHFLEFIAGALQVPLAEITTTSRELVEHLRWQRNCERLGIGLHKSIVEHDPYYLADFADPRIEMRFCSLLPNVATLNTFLGDYSTRDDVPRLTDNLADFWSLKVSGVVTVEAPFGAGNTVVLRGYDELQDRAGNVTWGRYHYITEFDGERIRTVEGLIRPCQPPPGLAGILTP